MEGGRERDFKGGLLKGMWRGMMRGKWMRGGSSSRSSVMLARMLRVVCHVSLPGG